MLIQLSEHIGDMGIWITEVLPYYYAYSFEQYLGDAWVGSLLQLVAVFNHRKDYYNIGFHVSSNFQAALEPSQNYQ